MAGNLNGKMIPLSGGDPIPLLKEHIVIGRREDCDITLEYPNVSVKHCELRFEHGGWLIKDLNSTNGVKVNGVKVDRKRLMPGDQLTIARHYNFKIDFISDGYGNYRDEEDEEEDILKAPLLERAGLQRRSKPFEPDTDVFLDDVKRLREEENKKKPSPARVPRNGK